MNLEFQGADGVGDTLDVVALSVCVVVHRVDIPLVASAVVRTADDAVHNWVAHVHVWRVHINFGAQYHRAFLVHTGVHFLEALEAFLGGTVAEGAFDTGNGRIGALFGNLVGSLLIDVCLAFADKHLGPFVKLVEIVGRVEQLVVLEAEPLDVGDY